MKRVHVWCAVVLLVALPLVADAATRYVAHTGTNGPNCGLNPATACRSISRAIALADPGDTILVGPGHYGDLNGNGVLGEPGEEIGSPGCSCVLSMNKNVIIISSAGAAVTIIDGRSVNVVQTVVVLGVGGEFGRPGRGFTVTETARKSGSAFTGHGIGINAADVKVRGNHVFFSRRGSQTGGQGIFIVHSPAAIRIEGNHVANWLFGIFVHVTGAAIVSKNQVTNNTGGIVAHGGSVVGNVATGNQTGIFGRDATVSGNTASMNLKGFSIVSGVFTRNNMFRNDICGVENAGLAGLNATNNYWGVATGPGAPPADKACGNITTTSPFATKPFKVQILKP